MLPYKEQLLATKADQAYGRRRLAASDQDAKDLAGPLRPIPHRAAKSTRRGGKLGVSLAIFSISEDPKTGLLKIRKKGAE